MKYSKKLFWLVPIIGLFLFIGCGEDYQYKKAKKINTIEGYESFIEKYPNSKFVELAEYSIDSLRYQEVKNIGTEDAYRKFLEDYPNTKYSKEINILLNPYPIYLSWVEPVNKPTVVDDLPNICYEKKAGTKIDKVSWKFKFLVSNDGELQEWVAMGEELMKTPSESGIITAENADWKDVMEAMLSLYSGESTIVFALFNTSGKSQLSNWLEATIRID
jgi:hypothetical protein